jgi:hypothetical protein
MIRCTKQGPKPRPFYAAMLLASLSTLGCGDDSSAGGSGNLNVILEAEASITDGIRAGTAPENISDGYSVEFSKYIISVGLVAMDQLGDNAQASDAVTVADYTALPNTGLELTRFSEIPTGQYSEFGFETPPPSLDSTRHESVSEEDFDEMVRNGWSYLIEGALLDEQGGLVRQFRIAADVPGRYSACAVEDRPQGVNVQSDSDVTITMHGDHLVFNGFPEEEGRINRQAQWLADIEDIDEDGVLSRVDFEMATDIGALFASPPQGDYELTGGPIPIGNAWDFVRAQLGTQGHILGEGECEWSAF